MTRHTRRQAARWLETVTLPAYRSLVVDRAEAYAEPSSRSSPRRRISARCPTRTSPMRSLACPRDHQLRNRAARRLRRERRVSMRGTNPSLTQTLIQLQRRRSGWFRAGPGGPRRPQRSFFAAALELVSQVIMASRAATAEPVEGGRRGCRGHHHPQAPSVPQQFTVEASPAGSTPPAEEKTESAVQAPAQLEERSRNVGVLVQAFDSAAHLRRDGQIPSIRRSAPTIGSPWRTLPRQRGVSL